MNVDILFRSSYSFHVVVGSVICNQLFFVTCTKIITIIYCGLFIVQIPGIMSNYITGLLKCLHTVH